MGTGSERSDVPVPFCLETGTGTVAADRGGDVVVIRATEPVPICPETGTGICPFPSRLLPETLAALRQPFPLNRSG